MTVHDSLIDDEKPFKIWLARDYSFIFIIPVARFARSALNMIPQLHGRYPELHGYI